MDTPELGEVGGGSGCANRDGGDGGSIRETGPAPRAPRCIPVGEDGVLVGGIKVAILAVSTQPGLQRLRVELLREDEQLSLPLPFELERST